MDMTPQTWPDWYDGRRINEVLFCQQFLDKHPMKCVRGRLFTVDGLIEDEGQIGNLILEEISGVLTSGLSKVVTNLLASIKLQAYEKAGTCLAGSVSAGICPAGMAGSGKAMERRRGSGDGQR